MCGFCPSGLTVQASGLKVHASGLASGLTVQASGLKVHASGLASGLASYQASGLIQNHVLNHRRTTLEAAARAKKKPGGTVRAVTTGRKDADQRATPAERTLTPSRPNRPTSPRRARAEPPTARATGACVWTATACPAQPNVTRFGEKHGCRGEDDRVGEDGGVVRPAGPGIDAPPLEAIASTPPRAETETRQPPETRGQRPDRSVSPEHGSPPNGGEPGRTHDASSLTLPSGLSGNGPRRNTAQTVARLTRTARKELADLAKGTHDRPT